MKKGVLSLIFLFALVISLSSVLAATNDSTGSDDEINKGYTCLENAVKNKSVSLQEALFASLALGSRSNIDSKISSEKKTNADCWPKAGCTLKETAQVDLVYNREGKSTDSIDEWLLSKNASMADLEWYIEIDTTSHQNASCTVKYDSSASSSISRQINIGNDQKLTGDSSNCFDISSNGYWLRINSNCYSKKFDVSCNKDFITSLAYFKSGGETMYVSSEPHSQASNGTTSEEIKARCFKTGSSCDYEGSLWATLALSRNGKDVSAYLPYLIALADDNPKFFPSAFIYLINGGTDQFNNIIQSQKSSKYWEISGSPGRAYDTSLAMLALSSEGGGALDNAKNYLLTIQDKNTGCWNNGNIRDTAFILYSGWTKEATQGGSGGSSVASCSSAGKECAKTFDCTNAGGNILSNYQCPTVGEFCCSVSVQKQTCLQQKGEICSSNQVCNGGSAPASDGTCCLGTCQVKTIEDTCTAGDGICRESCDSNEEEVAAVCSTSDNICCKTKAVTEQKGSNWLWIVLLIILIIIIAAAIVFRDKIKIWLIKFRGRAQTSPVRRGPPSPPGNFVGQRPMMPNQGMFGRPGVPVGRPMPHPIMRSPQPMGAPRPQPREANKEMEETLRKLKEMSK